MKKTPITIVTGHLGSGKTTLIQKVLDIYSDDKVLVIENEFGEIGIDGEILAKNKNALVELNSGCICCNIQSDLEEIFQKFIADKKTFDHIIIEATGVANPAKIARQFIEPSYLSNFFKLNSILCVVDSLHFVKHKELPEFELQLLTSDSIYLSKCENSINMDLLLSDCGLALSSQNLINDKSLKEWFTSEPFFKLDEGLSQKGGHTHYQKFAFEVEGEFDPYTLENCLNVIFMQYMGRIFRSKGILYFRKAPHPVSFQGVFDSLSFDELKHKGVDSKVNKLVFIGKDLNQEKIESSLKNCIVVEE